MKRPVTISQDRERRFPPVGADTVEKVPGLAEPPAPDPDQDRFRDQFLPAVRSDAQAGGSAQPLGGNPKPASTRGQSGGLGQQFGRVLVGFGGCRCQMVGTAHQFVLVERREVAMGVAAFLRTGVVNHRRTNQWMTKNQLPQGI